MTASGKCEEMQGYTKNKIKKITVEKTELQILEDQNNELKAREAKLKEKVSKNGESVPKADQ